MGRHRDEDRRRGGGRRSREHAGRLQRGGGGGDDGDVKARKVEAGGKKTSKKTSKKAGERPGKQGSEDRQSGSFTMEALYDYINESAAKLAKVVASQRQETEAKAQMQRRKSSKVKAKKGEAEADDNGWTEEDLRPRMLSVRTSIKDRKSGRRVRFVSEVEVYPLPAAESRDAWLSRRGKWGAAPENDEMWDGDSQSFKPTTAREWLERERKTNFKTFRNLLKPLFGGKDEVDAEVDAYASDADSSSSESAEVLEAAALGASEDGEDGEGGEGGSSGDNLDLEVEIELVEEQRDENGNTTETATSIFKGSTRGEIEKLYSGAVARKKKFEYENPGGVKGKGKSGGSASAGGLSAVDRRLKKVSKNLSGSQASAASAAGSVLVMKSTSKNNGVAFGAAVKRKVQLRAAKNRRPSDHARPKAPAEYYVRKKTSRPTTGKARRAERRALMKRQGSMRTPGNGFSMRERYIVILYLIPLLLIGIDDMWPYLEHFWNILANPTTPYKFRPTRDLIIPFWVKLIFPNANPNAKTLKNTFRVGFYLVEIGGFIVVLQLLQQLSVLFRAARSTVRVEVIDDTWDTDSEDESTEENEGASYAYLFKWQPQPAQRKNNHGDDDEYFRPS